MASCILFHGPGARAAAVAWSISHGRPLSPPLGDEGLTVDEARSVVTMLLSVPVGEGLGTVVVGPLDEAAAKSCDVLLKSIEEFDSTSVMPILWATDVGGVSDTIQSRCLARWADGDSEDDEVLRLAALAAVDCVLSNDTAGMLEAVGTFERGDKVALKKGREWRFLGLIAEFLAPNIADPHVREVWERVRKASQWRNPTVVEVLAALLPEVKHG